MKSPHWFKATCCLLLAAWPAAAVSVDVTFNSLTSMLNGEMFYLSVPGDSQGDPPSARLVMDVRLTANEPNLQIDKVILDFENPDSTRELQASLRMTCPNPNGGLPVIKIFADGLILADGEECRLGLFENGKDPVITPIPEQVGIRVFFRKDGIPVPDKPLVIPAVNLVSYENTTPFGAYRFPAKAEDLPSGHYWSGTSSFASHPHRFSPSVNQIYAYDLGVKYWTGTEWLWTYDADPDENADYLVYGLPLYGMADNGKVTQCVDSHDDKALGAGDTPLNFIKIRYDNSPEIVAYAHIQKGSATASGVCFEGAVVQAGQLVAKVGNNGQSSNPHLHIEILRDEQPVPVQFRDMFVVKPVQWFFPNPPLGNASWAQMREHGFGFSSTLAWPSPLRRRGDVTDTGIMATSLVQTTSQDLLSASRTSTGNLKVSLWRTASDGEIVLDDTENSGAVSKVSLTRPFSSVNGVLGMITGSGTLKLAGYRVNVDTLTREGELAVGPASEVATAEANFVRGFVTALRTATGSFKLIAWQLDTTTTPWQFVRRGEAIGGAVQQVAVAKTVQFPGVVTAVRTSTHRLELSTFRLTSNGDIVTEMDEAEDALIQQVSVARLGELDGEDLVVTAAKTLAGNIELVAWSISPLGVITRLGDWQGPTIGEISIARATNRTVIGSYRDGSGDLNTALWQIDEAGFIRERTTLRGGAASAIFQSPLHTQSNSLSVPSLVVTGLRDGAGNLKLISQQVNLRE